MLRALLIEGALFLLPFVVYAVLVYARRGTLVPADWTPRVLILTSLAALVLVALGLLLFERGRGSEPGSVYVPAHMENGVYRPGQFK